jgi:exosortase
VFFFGQWGSDDYSHGIFVPIISAALRGSDGTDWRGGLLRPGGGRWSFSLEFFLYTSATCHSVCHSASLPVDDHRVWLSRFSDLEPLRETGLSLGVSLTASPSGFFYNALSSQLQLWSSALGVGVLQAIGVTAFREGNVIDLGPVQLQVAEACSGIRYLFP